MKFMKILLFATVCLAAGAVAGMVFRDRIPWFPGQAISRLTGIDIGMTDTRKTTTAGGEDGAGQAKESEERKILFYRSPMNPAITSPVPAKDQMGMDYVPVYADQGASNQPAGTVSIDPVVEQNMGVRTGMAMFMELGRQVNAYGRIAWDEERIASVYPRFRGWLQEVKVTRTGDYIKKGQVLAEIYSPELVSTQQDYLLAVKALNALTPEAVAEMPVLEKNARAMVESARKRLSLFGVSSQEIAGLEKSGRVRDSLEIRSSVSGTVIRTTAVEGRSVTPATELYAVGDPYHLWILADVYETDYAWINPGDPVKIRSAAFPGVTFTGAVDFVYPYVKKNTRTVQVRVAVDNPEGILKPDQYVSVNIVAGLRRVLAIPSEAVIRTGTRTLVFVQREPGKFEPRDVVTGVEDQGYTAIISGLKQHELVVKSAQFLIDSESSLREATLKMTEPAQAEEKASSSGDEEMEGMDMGSNTDEAGGSPEVRDMAGMEKEK